MTTFIYLGDIRHTRVSQEIVELAGKHTSVQVVYSHLGEDHPKADILIDENADDSIVGDFWEEFDRLQKSIRTPLVEEELHDLYPIHVGYWYTVNGNPREFLEGANFTARRWKSLLESQGVIDPKICRCDMFGRLARLPLQKEYESPVGVALNNARVSHKQKKRARRQTFKIRKVS